MTGDPPLRHCRRPSARGLLSWKVPVEEAVSTRCFSIRPCFFFLVTGAKQNKVKLNNVK